MKKSLIAILSLVYFIGFSQDVRNDKFNEELIGLLDFSVPTISVEDAYAKRDSFLFLDSREINEYTVSHIENAVHVGFKTFGLSLVKDIPKGQPIIIYCSVGYRSEKIGEKLIASGFQEVHNLYGSIFEWVNCGFPIVNDQRISTDTLHTYNQSWSQWVTTPEIFKWW